MGWRVAGGARPGAQQSVTARPAVRGLPWAHAQHPKVSSTRATVCAGFVPPALTSPRGPGGELRPCGPCNVGTLWRHHKDTCPSLQVQRKVYALCRISLDFHKNPELKNEILSQMRKTSERKTLIMEKMRAKKDGSNKSILHLFHFFQVLVCSNMCLCVKNRR